MVMPWLEEVAVSKSKMLASNTPRTKVRKAPICTTPIPFHFVTEDRALARAANGANKLKNEQENSVSKTPTLHKPHTTTPHKASRSTSPQPFSFATEDRALIRANRAKRITHAQNSHELAGSRKTRGVAGRSGHGGHSSCFASDVGTSKHCISKLAQGNADQPAEEICEVIMKDVHERCSHVKDDVKVTLVEANEILSSFDISLRQYAMNHLTKSGVNLVWGVMKEVSPTKILLSDGTLVPYDLLVCSTGVGPFEFVKSKLAQGNADQPTEEICKFITKDVRERYSHVKDNVKVTLIEANEILSSFDINLRQYATNHLTKSGVNLVWGVVKEVSPTKILLSDGTLVPYDLLALSTGVGPFEFVKLLDFPRSLGGRTGIDQWLCAPSVEDVFALGDCAGFLEQTGQPVPPALAQANEILSSFDISLRQYATNHLTKSGENLVRGVVKEVSPTKVLLSDGTLVPYVLLGWSTGVGPFEFVKSLDFPRSLGGRTGIDQWLRVEDDFALGDCAGFLEQIGQPVPPALAQEVTDAKSKMLASDKPRTKVHESSNCTIAKPFHFATEDRVLVCAANGANKLKNVQEVKMVSVKISESRWLPYDMDAPLNIICQGLHSHQAFSCRNVDVPHDYGSWHHDPVRFNDRVLGKDDVRGCRYRQACPPARPLLNTYPVPWLGAGPVMTLAGASQSLPLNHKCSRSPRKFHAPPSGHASVMAKEPGSCHGTCLGQDKLSVKQRASWSDEVDAEDNREQFLFGSCNKSGDSPIKELETYSFPAKKKLCSLFEKIKVLLELNGYYLGDYPMFVDEARPRPRTVKGEPDSWAGRNSFGSGFGSMSVSDRFARTYRSEYGLEARTRSQSGEQGAFVRFCRSWGRRFGQRGCTLQARHQIQSGEHSWGRRGFGPGGSTSQRGCTIQHSGTGGDRFGTAGGFG